MPPDPLSCNMSDVNQHLTQCEPPPYLKAGSAPALSGCLCANMHVSSVGRNLLKINEHFLFHFDVSNVASNTNNRWLIIQ